MSGLISQKQKQSWLPGSGEKRQRETAAVSVNIGRARFCFGAASEDLFGVSGFGIRRDAGEA